MMSLEELLKYWQIKKKSKDMAQYWDIFNRAKRKRRILYAVFKLLFTDKKDGLKWLNIYFRFYMHYEKF